MGIREAIRQELLDDSAVAALVSTRIYPAGRVPSTATLPYLSYHKVDNVHERHQTGGSGLAHPRVQIDCWGSSPSQADGLYDAVREALDNFRGTLGSGSNTATVRSMTLENDMADWIGPEAGTEEGPCRVIMDFIVWHTESAVDNIA